MIDPDDRFDALLDAMVNKPPLVTADEPSPDEEPDAREGDAD